MFHKFLVVNLWRRMYSFASCQIKKSYKKYFISRIVHYFKIFLVVEDVCSCLVLGYQFLICIRLFILEIFSSYPKLFKVNGEEVIMLCKRINLLNIFISSCGKIVIRNILKIFSLVLFDFSFFQSLSLSLSSISIHCFVFCFLLYLTSIFLWIQTNAKFLCKIGKQYINLRVKNVDYWTMNRRDVLFLSTDFNWRELWVICWLFEERKSERLSKIKAASSEPIRSRNFIETSIKSTTCHRMWFGVCMRMYMTDLLLNTDRKLCICLTLINIRSYVTREKMLNRKLITWY